jgi:hypothetical protein
VGAQRLLRIVVGSGNEASPLRVALECLSHRVVTLADMQPARLLERIRRATSATSTSVTCSDSSWLSAFEIGGRGSHRIFARTGVRELVNLQAEKGQAKPYQIRQIATLVRRYDLHLEDET